MIQYKYLFFWVLSCVLTVTYTSCNFVHIFAIHQVILALVTVSLMWLGSPRFRDSESLATGLVALWFLVHTVALGYYWWKKFLQNKIEHFVSFCHFCRGFCYTTGGAGFLPSKVWFMMDPFLPSISFVKCFGVPFLGAILLNLVEWWNSKLPNYPQSSRSCWWRQEWYTLHIENCLV